jgi:hypothetical protein
MRGAAAALAAVAIAFAISAPAGATSSGRQTFKGVIVVSGASGAREVVKSVVVAKGVFRGVGRVVEIPDQPGDPADVVRDDLVFAAGVVHIRGVVVDTSLSIDPRTCIYSGRVQHTGTVVGGTKLFAAATGNYTATVRGWGRARRASDGTCTVDEAALYEIDTFVISGSMTL